MTCACQAEHTREISTVRLNQCNIKTSTIQACTNHTFRYVHTATIHSTKFVYQPTTVHVNNCPSPTPESNSKPTLTKRTYYEDDRPPISSTWASSTIPTATKEVATLQMFLIPVMGGLLVVLLLVVSTGWVCTHRIMKKRGKMEINTMQDRYCMLEVVYISY